MVSIVMLLGLFYFRSYIADPAIFDLRFNGYALISITSALVNFFFLVYISKSNIRGGEAVWFYLFILSLLFYSIFEMFQRLSASPEGAMFWARLLGIITLAPVASFLFILNYLHPNLRQIWTTGILLASAMVLFFFHANGDLLFDTTKIKEFPWGYNSDIAPGFLIHEAWVLTLAIVTIWIFISFIRSTTNPLMKKQAKFFLIAFIFPFIGGISTEVIIPLSNNGEAKIVPLTPALTTLTAGVMIWGLRRYRAFEISPAMLSEEILALMNESVIVVDKDMRIEFVNQETKEAFTSAGGKIEGAYVTEFLDAQSTKRLSERLRHLKMGETAFLDDIVINVEASNPIYGRLAISRMTEDNGFDGYVIVISDVTELKHSYEALEQEKANVEHTVQVRTKELREAKERIIETDKMKTEFVILTSHHLRTPLTIIKGKLELLNMPSLKEEDKSRFLEDAQTSAKKLGELVEDLLTISTIEAGNSLVLDTVSASEVLDPLIEEAKQMMSSSENTLQSNIHVEGVMIRANANRLRGGIRNILDNAFKFTKNGIVAFDAGADEKNLWITIRDNGTGIADEEMPKLFTKFHRGTDVMQYEYDGEGIGLYLAKLIFDEHKGKIEINSRPDVGTGVKITIPLAIKEVDTSTSSPTITK